MTTGNLRAPFYRQGLRLPEGRSLEHVVKRTTGEQLSSNPTSDCRTVIPLLLLHQSKMMNRILHKN